MSTVTSDAPVAKVPEVTGMRKNGESFSACQYPACVFYFRLVSRAADLRIRPCPILYISTNYLSGKSWHDNKKAFRPTAGQTSYAKRQAKDQALAVIKAQEKEMKEEKEAERQVRNSSEDSSGARD